MNVYYYQCCFVLVVVVDDDDDGVVVAEIVLKLKRYLSILSASSTVSKK